ncbi:MAG TPA: FecR domain-containing protein [Rhizomicrobium sp.]|nr:FecR domain-containing protein [Rhizomicrobium sp.]
MSPQTSNANDIQAIAADWLLEKREAESWTAERQSELDAWLAASLAHRIAYWRLDAAWTRADLLRALRKPNFAHPPAPPRRKGWGFVLRTAAAACVLAVIVGTATYLELAKPALKTYATAVGERERLTLADGSQIELNTNTVLRTQINAHQRNIWLDRGEVYFEVTHNAKKPFVVMVAGHRLVDIGTKFVVRRDDGQFRVAVLEGSVALDDGKGGQEKILQPGDVAIASAGRIALTRKTQAALSDAMGWKRGVLVFDATPLSEAVREFNRYSNRKLVITDPQTAALTIDGTFPSNNAQAFIRLAQAVLGLTVKNRGDDIVISK